MSKVFSRLSCHAQMSKGDSKVGGEPIFRHKLLLLLLFLFKKIHVTEWRFNLYSDHTQAISIVVDGSSHWLVPQEVSGLSRSSM